MDKKLIVANWKNHPDTLAEAEGVLDFVNDHLDSLGETKELSLVICPPFVFLEDIGKILKMSHLRHNTELGAQDIALDDQTTATGEISGRMLRSLGVRYVIVGHSERRWKLGESDRIVNQKLKTVLKDEMVPIVCVGELNKDEGFEDFLRLQVEESFRGLSSDEMGRCIIAYEPVWSISTNLGAHPDSPESAVESIQVIKNVLVSSFKLKTFNRFLYGGSVNSKNITDFLKEDEINGVLVGGASVNKEEFVKILSMVRKL